MEKENTNLFEKGFILRLSDLYYFYMLHIEKSFNLFRINLFVHYISFSLLIWVSDSKVTPLVEKAFPVDIASICPFFISILPPGTSILEFLANTLSAYPA